MQVTVDPAKLHDAALGCYALAVVVFPINNTLGVELGGLGLMLEAYAQRLERLAALPKPIKVALSAAIGSVLTIHGDLTATHSTAAGIGGATYKLG